VQRPDIRRRLLIINFVFKNLFEVNYYSILYIVKNNNNFLWQLWEEFKENWHPAMNEAQFNEFLDCGRRLSEEL
jgi:hypothetical protein